MFYDDADEEGQPSIAISDLSTAISRKRCKIGLEGKLVLIINRKSYMSFRLVPKSVTLSDLERRNGRYFALFQRILVASGHTAQKFTFAISSPERDLCQMGTQLPSSKMDKTPIFGPCLLWPNGWMNQDDSLAWKVSSVQATLCQTESQLTSLNRGQSINSQPISIVAKRLQCMHQKLV